MVFDSEDRLSFSEETALRDALRDYQKAAKKFIAKVDSGQARSVTTYRELKACYAASKKILGD